LAHIAFLSTNNILPWGGSEELWAGAARHLLARGHQVEASVYDWPAQPRAVLDLQKAGCQVHRVSFRRSLRQRLLARAGLSTPDPFGWLDRRPDLTVVSSIGHPVGWSETSASRSRGIPYVIVIQAASELHWYSDPDLDRAFEGYVAARAVCFVSQGNLRVAETQFGRPLPNARVVRNPFNVRYEADPPWPESAEPLRLACVGRLNPNHKGQDLIIEVLGRPKWRERPLAVTFVGRGDSEQGLRRLAEWRKAAIRFQGFTDDIERVWAEHHGLLLPSRAEGLPLALVEAMLCGRMAVVTDVAGNAEMVEDGVSGFVAAAPTADLLDEALERAWARRHEWRAIGQSAGRRARQLVPADPAGEFADFLEATVRAGGA
jgi:glycosyltransferase involved in cell wall biosynthesis